MRCQQCSFPWLRTINDVTAIIDNEKPVPARLAKLKAEADSNLTAGSSRADLVVDREVPGDFSKVLDRANATTG